MLIDFESLSGSWSVDEGSASVVEGALELSAAPGERTRVRLTPESGVWNLWDYVNLTMDIENQSGGEARVRILIKDSVTSSETWYRPNVSHDAWVDPGETRVFDALMVRHRSKSANLPAYMDLLPEMSGLPHAQMLAWWGLYLTQIN